MKAVVAAFNQEKALVGAFSVITNLRMELFEALIAILHYLADQTEIIHSYTETRTFIASALMMSRLITAASSSASDRKPATEM